MLENWKEYHDEIEKIASNSFLELYSCENEEIITTTRVNLLKYCHLDTLAMVKVFEVLQKV